MKKIFEIPIYACDRDLLEKRVEKSRQTFFRKNKHVGIETVERAWKKYAFPKNNWDYNHIVGFIKIYKKNDDLFLDLYMSDKRYIWKSGKKIFLKNQFLNGTHFRMKGLDNLEIQGKIDELLWKIIEHNVKKSYYVDLDVYTNLKDMIDYRRL